MKTPRATSKIDSCLKNSDTIGNSNLDADDSPIGVSACERVGLVKVAKNCGYCKYLFCFEGAHFQRCALTFLFYT